MPGDELPETQRKILGLSWNDEIMHGPKNLFFRVLFFLFVLFTLAGIPLLDYLMNGYSPT